MSFLQDINQHRPVRVSAEYDPGEIYDSLEFEAINAVFQFCEEIASGNQTVTAYRNADGVIEEVVNVPDSVRASILDGLAEEGWSIALWGDSSRDDDVHEIYNFVATEQRLPGRAHQVMSVIENFRRNLAQRAFGRERGCANLWGDVMDTTESFLTESDRILNGAAIPGLSHASGGLSGLWNDHPRPTVTRDLVSFRPQSVQPQYPRARGIISTQVAGHTSVLQNLERVTWWAHVMTRLHTCFNLAEACLSFPENSNRWRQTLQQFREDPTPENLAAYGFAAGHMVQDISNMLNNPPISPTGGSIPFYGSIFRGVGDFTQRLVGSFGRALFRADPVLRDMEQERDGPGPQQRGV